MFAFCQNCGGEIYWGECYYEVDGAAICTDCLYPFARNYFISHLRVAGIGGKQDDHA